MRRKLNRITETDPEPMNTTEYLFQRMDKIRYFSKIDLSKGYWQICRAVRETLKGEISEMLKLRIIQESDSPYASSIVLVKKKDGSNRLCVES